jgi:hypothetical protein
VIRSVLRGPIVAILVSVALLAFGSIVYHYDLSAAWALASLIVVTLIPGAAVLPLLEIAGFRTRSERFVLSASIGFVLSACVSWLGGALGIEWIAFAYLGFTIILLLRWTRNHVQEAVTQFLYILPLAIVFVLCYNLANYHYTADGSIVARGLFGVDIPFLAGEVHGLRAFGHLADLHQSGLLWDYHDATYRILALTSSKYTLDTLAWVTPIFGYTVLAIAVYAIADRLMRNRLAALVTSVMWFVSGAVLGGEQSSYALSPSFVFGSVLLCAFFLALDAWRFGTSTKLGVVALVLLIALSRFKLSSFLVVECALGVLAVVYVWRLPRKALMAFALALVAGLQLLAIGTPTNPLTPAGDFLVGAPLLGYANHLAGILHLSVSELNPVTRATLSLKSVLVLPYFLFHFGRFVLLDPRLIAAIICGLLVRRSLVNSASPLRLLLIVILPVGFLLPVLYSPAWYPLALSFYAPLVSVQAAILLFGIAIDSTMRGEGGRVLRVVIPVVGVAVVVLGIRAMIRDSSAPAFIVSSELRSALEYLRDNRSDNATLATRRSDIAVGDTASDDSFYWYAALSGHPVISEGAKYGALLGAVADIDSVKGLHRVSLAKSLLRRRRAGMDVIYYSGDSGVVSRTIRRLGVGYVLERSPEASPTEQVHVDLSHLGHVIVARGNTRIWELTQSRLP